MSLDIAICDDNGVPTTTAPLGVDEHSMLIELAKERGFQLCLRMSDYYEDVEFAPNEIGRFHSEITTAKRDCSDVSLAQQLEAIERVVYQAMESKTSLCVIAD